MVVKHRRNRRRVKKTAPEAAPLSSHCLSCEADLDRENLSTTVSEFNSDETSSVQSEGARAVVACIFRYLHCQIVANLDRYKLCLLLIHAARHLEVMPARNSLWCTIPLHSIFMQANKCWLVQWRRCPTSGACVTWVHIHWLAPEQSVVTEILWRLQCPMTSRWAMRK